MTLLSNVSHVPLTAANSMLSVGNAWQLASIRLSWKMVQEVALEDSSLRLGVGIIIKLLNGFVLPRRSPHRDRLCEPLSHSGFQRFPHRLRQTFKTSPIRGFLPFCQPRNVLTRQKGEHFLENESDPRLNANSRFTPKVQTKLDKVKNQNTSSTTRNYCDCCWLCSSGPGL